MSKARVATVWLDGCSGCHMSLLDMDEKLVALASLIEMVYSPVADPKAFPENVDVTLVEGAVSSNEDVHKIQTIRKNSKVVVALGDCAVTGNVPSMRNTFSRDDILDRAFVENTNLQPQHPRLGVPRLMPKVRPLHEIVKVDVFIPGCPPSADVIFFAVSELLAGRLPDLTGKTRFGA